VLFSADFTSAEVYNKVSADHSPLKALTNNTLLTESELNQSHRTRLLASTTARSDL